ncbi:MAG: hypothetical protein JWQ35_412 [Bacteriovoracaceae bacterium]|nr:hypothetical protein [Bacteriovoracaceae bacterium]
MKRNFLKRPKSNWGIALFILMTAMAIMSLLMREMVVTSATQASRVRNSADRLEALYLARSSLNLARFILTVDRLIDSQKSKSGDAPYDRLDDIWATPNYFPLKIEEIQLFAQSQKDAKKTDVSQEKKQDFYKKCQNFFDDFPGNATSLTTDLSGRVYLNDLGAPGANTTFDTFLELLRPNVEFIRHLNDVNLQPETLAREIRDYMDADVTVRENNTPKIEPYTALQLDYEPKSRFYNNMDELKLIPHMDDFIFEYLSNYVNPYNVPASMRTPPEKINLNTVSKNVFQSLLKNQSDAESMADKFIKDRDENKRVYTDKDLGKTLSDTLRLTNDNIRLNMLTGVSDSFKIETTANVNNIELKLETIVARPLNGKKVEPIISMRISP